MANNDSVNLDGISFDEPEEGVKVQSRSGRYKPEKCVFVNPKTGTEDFFPVQGIVDGAEFRKSKTPKRKDYYDLRLRLTKPTFAVNGDTDKLVRLEEGDEIIMAATDRLKMWVEVARRENPEKVFEIWLKPIEKISIGDGNELWEYTVKVIAQHDPQAVQSRSALLLEKMAPVAPALTQGGTETAQA